MITLNSGDEIPARTNSILKTHVAHPVRIIIITTTTTTTTHPFPIIHYAYHIYLKYTEARLPFYPPLQHPSFKPLEFLFRTSSRHCAGSLLAAAAAAAVVYHIREFINIGFSVGKSSPRARTCARRPVARVGGCVGVYACVCT